MGGVIKFVSKFYLLVYSVLKNLCLIVGIVVQIVNPVEYSCFPVTMNMSFVFR